MTCERKVLSLKLETGGVHPTKDRGLMAASAAFYRISAPPLPQAEDPPAYGMIDSLSDIFKNACLSERGKK